MNLEEYAAKQHVLLPAAVLIPRGIVCRTPEEASAAVAGIGPSVIKAQVPTGKRGKSGGIKMADKPEEGAAAAREILGMTIGGSRVECVLVEERCPIERELYAAVLIDVASRSPLVLFSTEGGMDIEEVADKKPDAIRRHIVDVARGFGALDAAALLGGLDLGPAADAVGDVLVKLYRVFCEKDAELVEINPLAILRGGKVVALDCKFASVRITRVPRMLMCKSSRSCRPDGLLLAKLHPSRWIATSCYSQICAPQRPSVGRAESP